ncbi:MAG: YgaP family membrane protein [Candidatus Margulisiibacteriota bacterium]
MTEIKVNESTFERFVRIIVGGIFLILAAYLPMNAVLLWIFVIVGLILMLTGLCGYCPLYGLLNISTAR